jgi:hypothetical protein
MLDIASSLGIAKEEGRRLLNLANNILITHLEKEDEKIYRTLRVHTCDNQELKSLVDRFTGDIEEISKNFNTLKNRSASDH